MPLDERLRDMYGAAAAESPVELDPGTLDRVVVRTRRARRHHRLRAGAVVGAALLVTVVVVSPHALPWSSTEPVAPEHSWPTQPEPSVTSKAQGYGADAPPGWAVTLGTRPWTLRSNPYADGVADVYRSTRHEQITVASQRLPEGLTLTQWFTPTYVPQPSQNKNCYEQPWLDVTVDGQPGHLFGRALNCDFTGVFVVKGRRAYLITSTPDYTHWTGAVFDQSTLDAFLKSMRLTS